MNSSKKINCWQFKKCGREPGGDKVAEQGICPAAMEKAFEGFNNGRNAGRCCWLIAGTFCCQQVMGTFAEKLPTCKACDFYQQVQKEEHDFDLAGGDIVLFAATHIGLVKKANEDRYYCKKLPDNSLLFAVADGLGGQAAGDYAAEILRGKLAHVATITPGKEEETLSQLAIETDRLLLDTAEKDTRLEGMGTTLLCVLLRDNRAFWVHVGDSRLALYRKGQLRPLTEDQNLARYLLEQGEITPEEVATHYSRNVLDQALGSALEQPETGNLLLEPEDILMLSTDGFHNLVPPKDIVEVLAVQPDLKRVPETLVEAALANGGSDNVTLIVTQYLPKNDAHRGAGGGCIS